MTPPERDPHSDARAWEDIVRRLQGDDSPAPAEERPRGPRDFELAPEPGDEDPLEDDWQPEDPGPVTAGMRPGTIMAWAVLLGTAAAMLVLGFLLDGLPWWLWVPGLALILGSLASLFQALPQDRSEYDDGAQV